MRGAGAARKGGRALGGPFLGLWGVLMAARPGLTGYVRPKGSETRLVSAGLLPMCVDSRPLLRHGRPSQEVPWRLGPNLPPLNGLWSGTASMPTSPSGRAFTRRTGRASASPRPRSRTPSLRALPRPISKTSIGRFSAPSAPAPGTTSLSTRSIGSTSAFWLRPHDGFERSSAGREVWRIPVYPNGDYPIFLAEDFRFGIFGHPWERTCCIFGAELLAALEAGRPRMFGAAKRGQRAIL